MTVDVWGLPRWDWVIVAGLLLVVAWAVWYYRSRPRPQVQEHAMNCVNCYQPIRPTGERDGIEMFDGRYEYEWVHDNGPEVGGNPICPITCVATPPSP